MLGYICSLAVWGIYGFRSPCFFIWQVMSKLNTELAYARADLNDALYKGVGDINAARKRVIWLEDKMGELCGKKRLKVC